MINLPPRLYAIAYIWGASEASPGVYVEYYHFIGEVEDGVKSFWEFMSGRRGAIETLVDKPTLSLCGRGFFGYGDFHNPMTEWTLINILEIPEDLI